MLQGNGLGSQMFDFAEALAPISEVGVISVRDDLFPFYGKRGYVVTSRDPIEKHIPVKLLIRTGVNFSNILRAAFTLADPESVRRY